MNIWIGVNSDGSEIMSKRPLKRFFSIKANKNDVLSYQDTQQLPHWMLDYSGVDIGKRGDAPIDVYLTLPQGSLKRLFGVDITWDDDFQIVEL